MFKDCQLPVPGRRSKVQPLISYQGDLEFTDILPAWSRKAMTTTSNTHQHFGEHIRHNIDRWTSALEQNGFDSVLVHSGTPMYSFLDDYEYPFRPNPHFLSWLPLTHHHDSALLIRPGNKPRLCFYQPDDYWYLPPADPESWWADHFDIQTVAGSDDWVGQLRPDITGNTAAIGDSPSLEALFPQDRINPENLVTGIHLQRTRKTGYEIACMAEASRLAVLAHHAAENAFMDGRSELEIHQAYLASCGHTDARLPYHNIVALNEHGAVLHYQGREATVPGQSRSFLLDAGCTFNAYCSDITRTYSRNSGLFADLISEMDQLQQQLGNRVEAGVDFRDLHLDTHRGIAGILSDAGVIRTDAENAVESGLSSVFYPHGLGHYIGLQTHDVAGLIDNDGNPSPTPDGHPFLRLTRVLEASNVLTIEPGLYFIESLLNDWRDNRDASVINWDLVDSMKPYGGVRIEDNLVVEEGGNRNLTREAFAAL